MRNKKIIALFIACLLLFVAVISNAGTKELNKKKVIYVDSDYNNPKKPSDGSSARPYTKIQQGIDAASPGDTVFVFNGIYNEDVVVNKTINLIGENKYGTIIHGYYKGEPYTTVYITADWVYMSGFNIQPNIFSLTLYYSNNSSIIGNNVIYNDIMSGLYLEHSNNNTITGNNLSGNIESGIHLLYSSYNTISDNKVTGNGDWGIVLALSSNYNTIIGNNVNTNLLSNIYLSDSNNNIISGNNASNCSAGSGIELYTSDYNTIMSNILLNNDWRGITLHSSSYNIIYNNFLDNIQDSWNQNANDDGNNIWNISKTPGTNIVGGSYLGGNYWTDYTGIDAYGDGIGDTPYAIPGGNNQDLCPLMAPYNI